MGSRGGVLQLRRRLPRKLTPPALTLRPPPGSPVLVWPLAREALPHDDAQREYIALLGDVVGGEGLGGQVVRGAVDACAACGKGSKFSAIAHFRVHSCTYLPPIFYNEHLYMNE
jgi:hypothetical protein